LSRNLSKIDDGWWSTWWFNSSDIMVIVKDKVTQHLRSGPPGLRTNRPTWKVSGCQSAQSTPGSRTEYLIPSGNIVLVWHFNSIKTTNHIESLLINVIRFIYELLYPVCFWAPCSLTYVVDTCLVTVVFLKIGAEEKLQKRENNIHWNLANCSCFCDTINSVIKKNTTQRTTLTRSSFWRATLYKLQRSAVVRTCYRGECRASKLEWKAGEYFPRRRIQSNSSSACNLSNSMQKNNIFYNNNNTDNNNDDNNNNNDGMNFLSELRSASHKAQIPTARAPSASSDSRC